MSKKKKANGQGTWFYDEKKKLYTYRVPVIVDGKTIRKPFSGKTQEIAMSKFKTWENQNDPKVNNVTKLLPESIRKTITTNCLADDWFKNYTRKIEESTAASYEFTLRHIKNKIGIMIACEVEAEDVENMLEELVKEGYSSSQIGKVRAMTGQIMRYAIKKHIRPLEDNPVEIADKTNYRRVDKAKQRKKDSYNLQEVALLYCDLPDTRIGHSTRLMIGAGLSEQEILGINKNDIAEDGSRITIHQAVKLKKGGKMYIGTVKAEMREAEVHIPPSLHKSALYLRENATGFVIQGRKSGMPIHPNTFRKFYKKMLDSINIRYLPPHCCRHTFVTQLRNNGIDLETTQTVSRHSDEESTRGYNHLQKETINRIMDVMDKVLMGKISEPTSEPTHTQDTQKEHQKTA